MAASISNRPHLTPFDMEDGKKPKNFIELRMIRVSQGIRSKKGWRQDRKDPQIVSKWEPEAVALGFRKDAFQYIIDELDYYESLTDGAIEVSIVDGVWQADNDVEDCLKTAFKNAVQELLEDVLENEIYYHQRNKSLHPRSKDLVLDLVHPSLYCFVYGVTRETSFDAIPALLHLGAGDRISKKDTNSPKGRWKVYQDCCTPKLKDPIINYQWLPAEFHVNSNGIVSILSYINNLHPEVHARLYPLIAQMFEKFVPLFNRVLTDLQNPTRRRVEIYLEDFFHTPINSLYYDSLGIRDLYRHIKWPTFEKFKAPSAPESVVDLKGKNLQVILKLANIGLTPEKPVYEGGVWQVDGVQSERIVASGIYCYSSENITESRLEFRQAIRQPFCYLDDYDPQMVFDDFRTGYPMNQSLGSVETRQDRLLAYPNIFQHRVAPFKLVDPSKTGHRKILSFFLVDPNTKIVSTKNVPPQQRIWFEQRLRSIEPFSYLPPHIFEKIMGYLDWPMSVEDAKKYREDLISERKDILYAYQQEIFDKSFCTCQYM